MARTSSSPRDVRVIDTMPFDNSAKDCAVWLIASNNLHLLISVAKFCGDNVSSHASCSTTLFS